MPKQDLPAAPQAPNDAAQAPLRANEEGARGFPARGQDNATPHTAGRFHLTVEAAPVNAFCSLDADGRIIAWNEDAARLTGYSEREILGQHVSRLHVGESISSGKPSRELMAAAKNGRFEEEAWRVRRDGSRFWAQVILTPLYDPSGKVIGFSKLMRDMTFARYAEAEDRRISEMLRQKTLHREADRRFHHMVDALPELVWMSGPDDRLVFVNLSWLLYTGRDPKRTLREEWARLVCPPDQDLLFGEYDAALKKRDRFTAECRAWRFDAKQRWLLFGGTPWFDGNDKFAGYIGSCIDVTLRREIEAREREQRSLLAHLARLNIMGEMASILAHEISQPLGAIANYSHACLHGLAKGGDAERAVAENLERIAAESQRAAALVRRIREYSRKAPTESRRVSVNSLIQSVSDLLRGKARESGCDLRSRLCRELPEVCIDPLQIEQVLANLIYNGIEAMVGDNGERRELTVSTAMKDPRTIVISVHDTGPGLDSAGKERVFEPFYSTKRLGTGIGLSVCRSIVEAHGGVLGVESEAGGGATFCFTLPVSEVDCEPDADSVHRG